MFKWLRELQDIVRELRKSPTITEEMIYTVMPTIWVRKSKIRERLLNHYRELKDLQLSDALIYACLRRLEVRGMIECDTRTYPKMHYPVGICRKTGPKRPSLKIETTAQPIRVTA